MKKIYSLKPNWKYFSYTYALFAAGFFFLIRPKYHNLFYYITLLTPYLLLIKGDRITNLLKSSIFKLAIAYSALFAISVLWASPPEPIKLSRYLFHFLYLIAFIALTIELVHQNRKFPDLVIKAVMTSATIWIPISILLFYQDHPWTARIEGLGRLENPIAGGMMYGMVAILCLHAIIQKDRLSTIWRILAVTCGILCLVYMTLSQSRSPLIGLLLAGTIYTALQGYWKLLVVIIGVCFAIGIMFYLEILPFQQVISRGLSYRPEIWMQILPLIMENPWFGHGATFDHIYHLPNHPDVYSHTHSALFASLVFVGIVGTSILLALIAQSFRYAFRSKDHLATSLLIYAMVNLLVNGYQLVDHPEIEWLYFWFPVAIAAASEIRCKSLVPCRQPDMAPG